MGDPTQAPIGVFDSGIGGLSVLQALRGALPHERFVYLADSAHAPYGERAHAAVAQRTDRVAAHLRQHCGAKALVVACNTATAAAVHHVREQHPGWPVIGLEPALKPAAHATRTGRVGVLATRATLSSAKYRQLRDTLTDTHGCTFIDQACDGLAAAIEASASGADANAAQARAQHWLRALGPLGHTPGAIDTVVLGCTHYPLIRDALQAQAGTDIALIDSGAAVARHTQRTLSALGLLRAQPAPQQQAWDAPLLRLLATGDGASLQAAAARWLQVAAEIERADAV